MAETSRDRGARYALSALRKKRAELASEIVHLERQLRHRKDSLGHVDATLRLLDPSIDTKEIPNKRYVKRVKLFRQGELGRMILGALRDGNGQPVTTAAVVTAILKAGGHGEAARTALAPRIRSNLAYLERRRLVTKLGDRTSACWRLS
jgi:hypothetical protein